MDSKFNISFHFNCLYSNIHYCVTLCAVFDKRKVFGHKQCIIKRRSTRTISIGVIMLTLSEFSKLFSAYRCRELYTGLREFFYFALEVKHVCILIVSVTFSELYRVVGVLVEL